MVRRKADTTDKSNRGARRDRICELLGWTRQPNTRLQSTTADNVVNYTAVISVKNEGGKLLPGMTATVQFETASANNVLTVPNAALKRKP